MSDQPITPAGITCAEPAGTPGQDRLESLIHALIELKSNIAVVEQRHPTFSNDLSSLCDIVIEYLRRPEDACPPQSPEPCISFQPEPCRTFDYVPEAIVPDEALACAALIKAPQEKPNPIAAVFDRAGDGMIKGLDKMGDGIIFIFEKLLSLGPRKKNGNSQDPV
ncbi:MAG: hypothetical protein JW901_11180 [Dehalococcoidia bacterium]|nr:hypothetical protein [Dehalococcoidia bacterium]